MPIELRVGLQCERWNALPLAGGLLEQPLGLMNQMTESVTVYRLCHLRATKTATEWAQSNPAAARLFFEIDEYRAAREQQSDPAAPA